MNIGVLRKEVDGQGLTSKNGITPIARQIIKSLQNYLQQENRL